MNVIGVYEPVKIMLEQEDKVFFGDMKAVSGRGWRWKWGMNVMQKVYACMKFPKNKYKDSKSLFTVCLLVYNYKKILCQNTSI